MSGVEGAGHVEGAIRAAAPAALATLVRRGQRFADAEDAVQEALVLASQVWRSQGLPERPVGWVVRVAQRRLVDRYRSDAARQRREALVASWSVDAVWPATHAASEPDDELALLFLCCHDVLTPTSAIPLTLRAIGGLSTRAIADALLVSEATVAQRISRAKASILDAELPLRRPPPDLIDRRLPSVMQVISLIFTEGHAASTGGAITRVDLSEESIRLARSLHARLPDQPEAAGLLALLLLSDARRRARTDANGELVPLDQQDRSLWDRPMISEGMRILTGAFAHHALGEYQLQAAIAAVHDEAPTYAATEWARLRALYDLLLRRRDDAIVRLNRVVVVAHVEGPEVAMRELEALRVDPVMAAHHRFHATVGYVHELARASTDAQRAYQQAAALASNDAERRYLERKASMLSP